MILITGGAGYVGSHANKCLHQNGYETVVFDSLIRGHHEFVKWGKFIQGDLANKDQLRRCFSENAFEAVMHFAGLTYVGESVTDPALYYENNVANTLKLLNVMKEFGVDRFIFSSSCAVYGNPERLPLTEDHSQRPVSPYGRTKLIVEKILKDYENAYGVRHVNLRYFNAAGADPDCEIGEWHAPETHIIPLVLEAAIDTSKDVRIFGTDYDTADGTCIRDYIHVTDLADAHLLALQYLANGGASDSFNLGNGDGFSVKKVITTAEDVTGRKLNSIPWPRREGDPPILIGSSAKAKSILGWNPKYNSLSYIVETAWKWKNRKSLNISSQKFDS